MGRDGASDAVAPADQPSHDRPAGAVAGGEEEDGGGVAVVAERGADGLGLEVGRPVLDPHGAEAAVDDPMGDGFAPRSEARNTKRPPGVENRPERPPSTVSSAARSIAVRHAGRR
jgi:hypothetical protein